jgi:hypothetical protein
VYLEAFRSKMPAPLNNIHRMKKPKRFGDRWEGSKGGMEAGSMDARSRGDLVARVMDLQAFLR